MAELLNLTKIQTWLDLNAPQAPKRPHKSTVRRRKRRSVQKYIQFATASAETPDNQCTSAPQAPKRLKIATVLPKSLIPPAETLI
jgi:hypothetical protein